jgi:hypothetical protein
MSWWLVVVVVVVVVVVNRRPLRSWVSVAAEFYAVLTLYWINGAKYRRSVNSPPPISPSPQQTPKKDAQRAPIRPPVLLSDAYEGKTSDYIPIGRYGQRQQQNNRSHQPISHSFQCWEPITKLATMAAVAPAIGIVPPGGVPPAVAGLPQLPFGADPGTITGWLLDDTATEASSDIARGLHVCFNRLTENVPAVGDPGYYDTVMRLMTEEVTHSNTLVTYLTATNICNNVVRVTTVHSIAQYSAGFGGSNALHGKSVALLGEMVGGQLPMLVQFEMHPTENLAHALAMESVKVPLNALVDAYFVNPRAENLIPGPTVAYGGADMNLANFCPVPPPWFMDFKTPHNALRMGWDLVGTLGTLVAPLLDWLRCACVHLGVNPGARRQRLIISRSRRRQQMLEWSRGSRIGLPGTRNRA